VNITTRQLNEVFLPDELKDVASSNLPNKTLIDKITKEQDGGIYFPGELINKILNVSKTAPRSYSEIARLTDEMDLTGGGGGGGETEIQDPLIDTFARKVKKTKDSDPNRDPSKDPSKQTSQERTKKEITLKPNGDRTFTDQNGKKWAEDEIKEAQARGAEIKGVDKFSKNKQSAGEGTEQNIKQNTEQGTEQESTLITAEERRKQLGIKETEGKTEEPGEKSSPSQKDINRMWEKHKKNLKPGDVQERIKRQKIKAREHIIEEPDLVDAWKRKIKNKISVDISTNTGSSCEVRTSINTKKSPGEERTFFCSIISNLLNITGIRGSFGLDFFGYFNLPLSVFSFDISTIISFTTNDFPTPGIPTIRIGFLVVPSVSSVSSLP